MSKKDDLFRVLQRKWLTPMDAAIECGVFALSQRCGEFRKAGHCVEDKWVHTLGGARVKAFKVIPAGKGRPHD